MSEVVESISPQSLLALLKARRSIRRYRPDPVPDDMIEQLLEAGRWAPSASNRQPWDLIVVRDEAIRQQVAQHAAFYFVRWAHVGEAPLLILLCGNRRNRFYRQFLHEDIGLAGSQIMLQAKAMGLGTCWIGALDQKAIAGILKIPDHLENASNGLLIEGTDPTGHCWHSQDTRSSGDRGATDSGIPGRGSTSAVPQVAGGDRSL